GNPGAVASASAGAVAGPCQRHSLAPVRGSDVTGPIIVSPGSPADRWRDHTRRLRARLSSRSCDTRETVSWSAHRAGEEIRVNGVRVADSGKFTYILNRAK